MSKISFCKIIADNITLKVAHTIADLDGAEHVQSSHIAEAVSYRNLDRADWADMKYNKG